MKTGTLFVVATPIGNLKDITLRALEVLQSVDVILAEDTRITRKLLAHYQVRAPLLRYNEHKPQSAFAKVSAMLCEGQSAALVSDAGTPGVSDPGGVLVELLRKKFPNISIVPVPGPSAASAALSVAGFPASHFAFVGYPPLKKKRKSFFDSLPQIPVTPLVLYESPHRILKTLAELARVFGSEHEIFIAREMTKMYEEYFRGTISEAISRFGEEKARGEFVVIVR